jgi:hypothetical protein
VRKNEGIRGICPFSVEVNVLSRLHADQKSKSTPQFTVMETNTRPKSFPLFKRDTPEKKFETPPKRAKIGMKFETSRKARRGVLERHPPIGIQRATLFTAGISPRAAA